MTCKSEHDRANVWYQVECPHCGDVSMHNMLLEEFTCGECDRPFKPVKRCEPMDDFPRRSKLYLNEPAELAIRVAVDEVENLGASPLLTKAINLLQQARESVADYIDGPRDIPPLRALISDLSDALSDAGCPWSADGILDLRRRVARALPWDDCPDWLRPYRSVND